MKILRALAAFLARLFRQRPPAPPPVPVPAVNANPHGFSPEGVGALREMIGVVRRTQPGLADDMTARLIPGNRPPSTVATMGFGGDPSSIVTLGFSTEEKKP